MTTNIICISAMQNVKFEMESNGIMNWNLIETKMNLDGWKVQV